MYRQLLQSLYITLINLEKGTSASTRKGSLNLERDTEICKAQARVNKLTASLMALIIDSLQGSTEKLKRCGHSKQWWTDTLKSKSKKSWKVKHKPKPRSAVKNFPIRWANLIPNVRMIFCVLGTPAIPETCYSLWKRYSHARLSLSSRERMVLSRKDFHKPLSAFIESYSLYLQAVSYWVFLQS